MRLIDADALIEEIAGIPDLRTLSTKTIGKAINKMATIDPQPHWVPCNERLPEEDVEVLVTDDAGGITTIEVDRCGIYEDTKERFWYTSQHVIAWMPLPEPYQGKLKGADNG